MFLFKSGKHINKYYYCAKPEQVVCANTPEEVIPSLEKIESMQSHGFMLAGWVSYEAAVAFDPRHKVKSDGTFPLVYMMASRDVKLIELDNFDKADESHRGQNISPHINQTDYEESCSKVLEYIKDGDIYQANYSFRCDVELNSDPLKIFKSLEEEHPVPYSCFIDAGEWQILSQSPELFIQKRGGSLQSMPMKGTVRRGLTYEEDEKLRIELSRDKKSQAENVMIVDLMRNDLSRICELNTVKVPELFTATRYGSLHQLTSTVTGELKEKVNLVDILSATFPPGSITGAPKIRAMEIIDELEKDGRKLYTGSAGLFYPNGDFTLNVCIRTLICNSDTAQLGIGSGIVADSAKTLEWEECLLKSSFLNHKKRHKTIFETMLLEHGGIYLLEEHLQRLQNSCHYFKVSVDMEKLKKELLDLSCEGPARIRVTVDSGGSHTVKLTPLTFTGWGKKHLRLKISPARLNSGDFYLYHKTDCREIYNNEYKKALEEGFDEVLFLNTEEQVCEGAISNIFIRNGSLWRTPCLSCGLLPGTWRKSKIAELSAQECHLTEVDIKNADEIIIGNSVRKEGVVTTVN